MLAPQDSHDTPSENIGPAGKMVAYLFVVGGGLLIGAFLGLVVSVFGGLIPISC